MSASKAPSISRLDRTALFLECTKDGYVLLLTGDVMREGDEVLRMHDLEWVPLPSGHAIGFKWNSNDWPAVRRKKPATPPESKHSPNMNTNPAIAPGTTVYNLSGLSAKYVTATADGAHIVRPLYEVLRGDESYDQEGDVTQWSAVYLTPPREKLDATIASLSAQIEELHKTAQAQRLAARQAEDEMKARRDRIKQHEKLALLDDYLAGKITHYVMRLNHRHSEKLLGIRVTSVKDEPCDCDRDDRWKRDKNLKLLCLFGTSKGDISWKISQYSDGSGYTWTDVTPFTSLEAAQAFARQCYEAEVANWRAKVANAWSPQGIINQAKALGLPVPEDAVEAKRADEIAAANHAVVEASEKLKAANLRLANLIANPNADLPETA